MSGPKCAFNSATALRRVFMPANVGTSDSRYLHVTKVLVPALLITHSRLRTSWGNRTDNFAKAPRRNASVLDQAKQFAYRSRRPDSNGQRRDNADRVSKFRYKLARLPRDDEIQHPYVYMEEQVDGNDEQARLGEMRSVRDLLATLDRRVYSLQVVRMPDPEDPSAPRWPIVQIINKKQELARAKIAKEEKKKVNMIKDKEMELNWALAPHDLEHKLRTVQKFLAKGYKVQVTLEKKRGSKAKVTQKEANELLQKIVDAVAEVEGSQEWKRREGEVLKTLKIFFQGKLQDAEATNKDDAAAKAAT